MKHPSQNDRRAMLDCFIALCEPSNVATRGLKSRSTVVANGSSFPHRLSRALHCAVMKGNALIRVDYGWHACETSEHSSR